MTPKDNISFVNSPDFSQLSFCTDHHPSRLFPELEESAELSVRCFRNDFSASRIALAVEDCDASLLNMNVTSEVTESGEIVVDLRVNHRSAAAVARSLERYGYAVERIIKNSPESGADDTARRRVDELLTLLNV
ncbi:MAG: hypothetical protein HFJ94_04540 [Muribaculaceae bacterium]|nr:hypothetical protein [Muribaculaceae bacterium]